MDVYYNEIDQFCCDWLQNLMDAGEIPPGRIDNRSITEVQPDDLRGYTQCHWFAGLGGWAYALRLAGWPEDRHIWTGSPPCQDNSVAQAIHGKREGLDGHRSGLAHTWLDLIAESCPRTVFFENVPGINPWIGQIQGRLEGLGYTVSRKNRAASDCGAPHPRRRVWMYADRDGTRLEESWTTGPSTITGDPWASAPRGMWREYHPRIRVLDDGVPNRVATIRAFGNSIVPQLAATFIRAYMERSTT